MKRAGWNKIVIKMVWKQFAVTRYNLMCCKNVDWYFRQVENSLGCHSASAAENRVKLLNSASQRKIECCNFIIRKTIAWESHCFLW